jgi:hypothetical protein
MRALAAARAPTFQQRKERSQMNSEKESDRTNKDKTKEFTFESLCHLQILGTLSAQGDELLHQRLEKEGCVRV